MMTTTLPPAPATPPAAVAPPPADDAVLAGDVAAPPVATAPPATPPATTLPVADAGRPEVRRSTGSARRSDRYAVVGGAAAAIGLTTVLFTQLAPFDGVLGYVVIAYVTFLGCYAALVSFDEDGPTVRDRVIGAMVNSVAFLLLAVLALVVVYTIASGWPALHHLNFFTQDMSVAGPLDPLTRGGVLHAIIGTVEQISLALVMTVPLALLCAVFLNEIPGRFSRFVRTIVEAMTALPSIVAGLFIYATLILSLGFGRSGFAASLAISVMMLPIVIRAGDVVIRLVPGNLREAALALGASPWRTVWHVVLPTARSGLATAVILGTARGIGETSPVLLTAGIAAGTNANPFADWQVSLPLATFDFVKSPSEFQIARGFGSAAMLLLLVLLLFIVARLIGGRGAGQLGRRQLRRRIRASRADLERFDAIEARRGAAAVPGRTGLDTLLAGTTPSAVAAARPTLHRTSEEDRNA